MRLSVVIATHTYVIPCLKHSPHHRGCRARQVEAHAAAVLVQEAAAAADGGDEDGGGGGDDGNNCS